MVKVTGPALSLSASKSLGKTLTYQKRPSGSSVYLYKKPGDRIAYTPTWKQRNQRGIFGLIISRWQSMTPAEQATYNDDARSFGFQGTGFNYFASLAQTNLYGYLGLVGYWSFNDPPGNKVLDLSGQGNNLVYYPTYPSDCPVKRTGINDKFGDALYFDGSNDYLGGSTSLLTDRSSITVCFWIKPDADADWHCPLRGTTNNWRIQYGNYTLYINDQTSNNAADNIQKASFFTPSIWQFFTFTMSQTYEAVYKNGILSAQKNLTGYPLKLENIKIGQWLAGVNQMKGLIDEVRIFNRYMADLEVKKMYQLFL